MTNNLNVHLSKIPKRLWETIDGIGFAPGRSCVFLLLGFLLFPYSGGAQDDNTPLTRILFVFDASNSMNARWQSDTRISIARRLLKESLDELKGRENLELALRVYGHQVPIIKGHQDCEDTKLEVSFRPGNVPLIQSTIDKITPQGTTPIARSLELAADDFPPCDNCRNIIILITDGIEACDGDPCAVSRALQQKGVVLKPFVIGVGLDEDFMDTFNCVGSYFDATNEESFRNILDIVISQALNNTTLQVNLLDDFGKPLESNVTVNFFDIFSEKLAYGFVHTLNHRGNPDTLTLDPLLSYRMEVHTIPPIALDTVRIEPGRHNIVAIDAGQGQLEVKVSGRQGGDARVILRGHLSPHTLHVQQVNQKEKVLTGIYDLEVLTLPRTMIPEVEVRQNETTTVQIPEPGVFNLSLGSPGYGSISQVKGSKLVWVSNISSEDGNQKYVLQPGDYKLTYRSKNSKEVIYTIEREFSIRSGSATNLKL